MKPLWLLLVLTAVYCSDWACPPLDAEFKRVAGQLNRTIACRCQEDGFYHNVDGATIECSDSTFPMLKETLAVMNGSEVGALKIWGSTLYKIPEDFFKKVHFKQLSIDECELASVNEKAFSHVSKDLVSISFKGNQLNSKVLNLLKSLPKLQIIDLSSNVIGNIPKNIFPEDTRELNLDSNNIQNIEDGAFGNLRNLRKLTLSHNQLETITAQTFKGLDQLEVLILHHNHIKNIDYLAFAHMKKLRVVDLGTNDVPSVELRNLPKLEKIFLNNNNIQSFKETVLKELPSLVLVSMDRNYISEIDDGDLAGLSKSVKLESLTLSANNISHIGSKALNPIQHVSILALQNNQLEGLSEESSQSFLAPLYRLKTLLLSHNNLKKIKAKDLPRSVVTLAADNNKIEEIDGKAFEGMPMQRIYLNKNLLTYLPPQTFDSFDMAVLENVDISDNRWHCVCGKEWLVDWLDNLGDRDDMDGVLGCLANSNCGLKSILQTTAFMSANEESPAGSSKLPENEQPSSSKSPEEDNSRFECNICLDIARDAVVSMCGHLFCWPCLVQWLDTRPNRQVCPVCKSAISRDQVIPLYGRGGDTSDPRDKIPPRPKGQRTEPQQGGFPGFQWGGGEGGGGGVQFSMGIGIFPLSFMASWFTNGERRPEAPQPGSRQYQEEQFLSNVFMMLGIFFVLWLLIV